MLICMTKYLLRRVSAFQKQHSLDWMQHLQIHATNWDAKFDSPFSFSFLQMTGEERSTQICALRTHQPRSIATRIRSQNWTKAPTLPLGKAFRKLERWCHNTSRDPYLEWKFNETRWEKITRWKDLWKDWKNEKKKKRGKKKQIKTHDHMTLWMWHLRDNLHESVYIVGAQPWDENRILRWSECRKTTRKHTT